MKKIGMKYLFLHVFLIIIISSQSVLAAPHQIILLRHADKLVQPDPGPTLSAKGYVRALKFTFYYLNQYGEPDFIIAGKPKGKNSSIRELETIAPLVNILSMKYPETGFNILHPYTHDEHEKLADYLLHDDKFKDKNVLICWRHTKIVELAKALGVNDRLTVWPDDDYDSVYVIQYNESGKVINFTMLHNQYPIRHDITWDQLLARVVDL